MKRTGIILLVFILAGVVFSAPDFFGVPNEKGIAQKTEKPRTEASSPYELIGVVYTKDEPAKSYAIFLIDGRYLILKPGQGKRIKLLRVVDHRTVFVRVGKRKRLLRLKEKHRLIKQGGGYAQ